MADGTPADDTATLQARIQELEAENQRLRAAVREDEYKLAEFDHLIDLGSWELNLKTQEVTWSEGLYYILGEDRSVKPDMKRYSSYLSEVEAEKLSGAIRSVFMTGDSYALEHDLRLSATDHKTVKLFLKLLYDQDKQPKALLGIVQDVTDEKDAQDELRKLSMIFEKTSNAVAVLTPDGLIDRVNPGFVRLIGFTQSELKGTHFAERFAEGCDLSKPGNRFERLLSDDAREEEILFRTKRGDSLWTLTTVSPVTDFELNIISYVAVAIDITRRKEAEEEIRQANEELSSQRDMIARTNKEMTDSITYAQRIQQAMLPDQHQIRDLLPELFVLFKPRDIVSGDFYWFGREQDKIILAAVDCTGHGVPGAFMSMIGISFMSDIIYSQGTTEPDHILAHLHKRVSNSLKQSRSSNRDGMDAAVCTIDRQAGTLTFAGAKNPLVCIRDGKAMRLKGDKFPIGGRMIERTEREFTRHRFNLNKDPSWHYIFSDGFQDQFGGEHGRKYMTRPFRRLLESIAERPADEQKKQLEAEHDRWRGNYPQTDDIVVIGFRV